MKKIVPYVFFLALSGCAIYPMQTIMPLESKVVDSETGKPLHNIQYIRIVCDIHDFDCSGASLEEGIAQNGSKFELDNERRWGLYVFVPGGLPVPNHQIAIWKKGYKAVVFSQYDGNIDQFASKAERLDIREAINKIPKQRVYITKYDDPNEIFGGGIIKLERLDKEIKHNN